MKTIKPCPGWFEQCPLEIIKNVFDCLGRIDCNIVSCSIVNQRESVLAWDKESGKPLSNVICKFQINIVWMDRRTEKEAKQIPEEILKLTGLKRSYYFSALKIRWLLDNNQEVIRSLKNGKLVFGNLNSWIIFVYCVLKPDRI